MAAGYGGAAVLEFFGKGEINLDCRERSVMLLDLRPGEGEPT